jgi:hypothetical protein
MPNAASRPMSHNRSKIGQSQGSGSFGFRAVFERLLLNTDGYERSRDDGNHSEGRRLRESEYRRSSGHRRSKDGYNKHGHKSSHNKVPREDLYAKIDHLEDENSRLRSQLEAYKMFANDESRKAMQVSA